MSAEATTLFLESYSHAAISQNKRVRGILALHSLELRWIIEAAIRLRKVGSSVKKLVNLIHDSALEHLPQESRSDLARNLNEVHVSNLELLNVIEKYTKLIAEYLHGGYWRPIYRWAASLLVKYDGELSAHIEAFQLVDSAFLTLSKNDQETVARLLINPPEPNERLRRALEQHTMPECRSSAQKGTPLNG